MGETKSLILREEHKPRVSEKRVLRRLLDTRGSYIWNYEEACVTRTFIILSRVCGAVT
jgi:hypothetical protein